MNAAIAQIARALAMFVQSKILKTRKNKGDELQIFGGKNQRCK